MSKRPVLVIAADTHLRRQAWTECPRMVGDAEASFRQIFDAAAAHDAAVVLAGDVFDTVSPSVDLIAMAKECVERLYRTRGKQTFHVMGQHDHTGAMSWLQLAEGAVRLDTTPLEVDGVRIAGSDFVSGDRVRALLEGIPSTDVFVLHQPLRELLGAWAPTDATVKFVKGPRLLVAGDFHKHLLRRVAGRDGAEFLLASPGSTYLRASTEEDVKRFFVMHDDLSLSSCVLQTRPVLRSLCFGDDDVDASLAQLRELAAAAAEKLPPAIAAPLWIAACRRDRSDLTARMARESARLGAFLLVREARGGAAGAASFAPRPADGNARSLLLRHLDRVCQPGTAVHAACVELLLAADKRRAVDALVKRLLEADDETAARPSGQLLSVS